jgi:DNA-binding transcriptional LysR family regulator
MELRNLDAFVAVAQEGSFRKAADRLHVSTSPLSRRIRDLEAQLGTELFRRTTRVVELTPAGDALLPHALALGEQMDRAAAAARAAAGRPGDIVIGMRAANGRFQRRLAEDVLRPALGERRAQIRPIESDEQVDAILRGALHMGVVIDHYLGDDPRIERWPVLRETMGIALPDLPRFRGLRTVQPDDVAALRLITLRDPVGGGGPAAADQYAAAAAGIVRGADLIPGGITALIAQGDHCAVIHYAPDSPWRRSIAGPGVIVRRLPARFPKLASSACWLRSRADEPDILLLRAAIRAAYPQPEVR